MIAVTLRSGVAATVDGRDCIAGRSTSAGPIWVTVGTAATVGRRAWRAGVGIGVILCAGSVVRAPSDGLGVPARGGATVIAVTLWSGVAVTVEGRGRDPATER